MNTPNACSSCGYELGIGRFCTNCGQPVPGRHPEAAPVAGAPTTPPPVAGRPALPPPPGQVPPAARYPLFADPAPTQQASGNTVPPPPYVAPVTQVAPSSHPGPAGPPIGAPYPPQQRQRPRRPWLPWVVAVVVLALVATAGALLLARSGDDDGDWVSDDSSQGTDDATDGGPTQTPSSEPAQPDSTGSGAPMAPPDPSDVVDLSSTARAEVPAVAPPSRDRQNRPVRFVPANMVDGRPRTAWRMPGDGSGMTITFDLGSDVVLTEVGLINGYAKVDGADNWYRSNRRIRQVQWEFDDGTRLTQDLTDQRALQILDIDAVETSKVKLHLVAVTAPAKGEAGRDFTAISEVRLSGAPG